METLNEHQDHRILIVDMSKISRKILTKIFHKEGFETDEVSNGNDALQLLEKTKYSVVVTGLILEGMSGEDLCRSIRALNYPHYIYIIVSSGQNSLEQIKSSINAGADEFVEKPIKKPILLARLKLAERIIDLEEKLKLVEMKSNDLLLKDALTEVYNRHRIKNDLPSEISRAKRYHSPLSIILCDLDKFKDINDTYGHLAGDRVLKEVANRLKEGCRDDVDWVARYGGEEFMLILPETEVEGAYILAQRLCEAIETTAFDIGNNQTIDVTMSFGASGFNEFPERQINPDELIQVADDCLYKAKENGRNQVFHAICSAIDSAIDISAN